MAETNKSVVMDSSHPRHDDLDLGDTTLESLSSLDQRPAPPIVAERVRFAVPAVLSFDGYEETFEVSVLNLSVHGVAIAGPQGLVVHDRLRLKFRVDLSRESQSFVCEVMWVQPSSDQKAVYGLQFIDLDPQLAQHVEAAVRERVEGRAGEWSMPLLPKEAPLGKFPRLPLLLAGLFGLFMGAGITVLIMLGMGMPSELISAEPVPALPNAADAPEVKPGDRVLALPPVQSSDQAAPAAPEGSGAPATSAPKQRSEERGATPAPPASKTREMAPPAPMEPIPKPITEPAAIPTARSPRPSPGMRLRKIGLLRVEDGGDKVALTLLADGPVSHHDVFWLQNPTRLVVDINGRQSGFQSKLFEVGHPLVSRLRVGQHPGKVRFVIETGKNVSPKVQSMHQGNEVRVELSRAISTAAR